MSLFSNTYAEFDAAVKRALTGVRAPGVERVSDLLAASTERPLTIDELAEILESGLTPGAGAQFELLRAHALKTWRRASGNRVRHVAPIYVSSYCIDTCAYCNFSATRAATTRRRLSLEELDREIAAVVARGARVVELVWATDTEYTTERLVECVERAVRALKGEPGAGVLLCTEYLSLEAYQALRDAGLWGIVQWDETLSQPEYDHWHSTSPHKCHFTARIDNHDRATMAGLGVATGALFGLADMRYDALMQIAKARHLEAEYGRAPFVLGTARLKPIAGHELKLKTIVDDRAYETALIAYQLAMPRTGRWLQTRESFEMNLRNLLDGDVFTERCGEVTPGGYHQIETAVTRRGQFGVNELEPTEAERTLSERNFQIDYAWLS